MSKAKDYTGQTIGELTVLERKRAKGRTYYYCRCTCGNRKWIRGDVIGRNKSCGCKSEKTQFKAKDYTGQTLGRLTVLKKENGKWKCQCECGNICYRTSHQLSANKVRSCGCLRREAVKPNIEKAIQKHKDVHIVEGTNLQAIDRDEPISSNTSGHTGVSWDASRNKCMAQIAFQGKNYYLGRYAKKEDAIAARSEAEEKFFKPVIDRHIGGDKT